MFRHRGETLLKHTAKRKSANAEEVDVLAMATLQQPLVDPVAAERSNARDNASESSSEKRIPSDGDDASGDQGSSVLQTGLNMLNELEGAGILGLPYAIKLCGWVSLICLGSVGFMAGFTGYILAMCMYEPGTGKRVRDSYAAVGLAAFGQSGLVAVRIVQLANLLSVAVVYLVLVGSSMEILLPLGLEAAWLPLADRRMWTAAATVVVLPTVHLGGYKKLALMSALGLLCLFAVLVLGFYDSAVQIASNQTYGLNRWRARQDTGLLGNAEWPTWDEFDLGNLPAVVSIFVFAFSAHGIFPALEASMAEPRHFSKVVSVVFITNIALKTAFSIVCYLAYGQHTVEVVSGNFQDWCSKVVSVLIVVNTCLSFPLPLVPVFKACSIAAGAAPKAIPKGDGTQENQPKCWHSCCARAVLRTLVVLGCGLVAIAIPNFALAMGFMGSLTLSFLTFIFPTSFYLRIHGREAGIGTKLACVLVAAFGVIGGVAGIYSNVLLAISGGQQGNSTANITTLAADFPY
eukprot:INCI17193.6.p1 GENE.INCI17193.6~~INCI17193.6.p1  ORF type:complete len:518 (-),score=63.53 INCI17193.6:719-2272(-)